MLAYKFSLHNKYIRDNELLISQCTLLEISRKIINKAKDKEFLSTSP